MLPGYIMHSQSSINDHNGTRTWLLSGMVLKWKITWPCWLTTTVPSVSISGDHMTAECWDYCTVILHQLPKAWIVITIAGTLWWLQLQGQSVSLLIQHRRNFKQLLKKWSLSKDYLYCKYLWNSREISGSKISRDLQLNRVRKQICKKDVAANSTEVYIA